MARVRVDSGELPSARGKKGWDLERVLQSWQSIADGHFEYDCRALLQMINEVDELRMWEYAKEGLYKTRDEFLEKVVLIDFDLTEESLKQIVTRLRGGETVKLGKHGVNQYTGDRQSTSIGRANVYRLARLKRDHPEIREAYDRGEFKSVRAAAIAARIIKPATPIQLLRSAWKKATPEERTIFYSEIEAWQISEGCVADGLSDEI